MSSKPVKQQAISPAAVTKAPSPPTPNNNAAAAKAPQPPAPKPKPAGPSSSGPKQNFAMRMAEQATKNLKLAPCKFCNRKFAENRLEEHEKICSHIQKKPRKLYDSQKHRLTGTLAEPFMKSKSRQTKLKHPTNNWKKKHEEFIQMLKSALTTEQDLESSGKAVDLPPPPASDNSDFVQCPYCGRRFNETAANRHIPACKDMTHNKPGGGGLSGKPDMSFKKSK